MAIYESISRDVVTFRTHSAKRKSAVEILQATKSLYIKSPKCQDDSRLPAKRECAKKSNRRNRNSDQLQTKLRKLLDDSSKENITDWDCLENLNFKFYTECDVQYQSLPDLSVSSKESMSYTIHQQMSDSPGGTDPMTVSSESEDSSSEKSYGKPPSSIKSLLSLGGSAGKLEERLTTWTQPKHQKISRSKSWECEQGSPCDQNEKCETSYQSLPKDLNDFFQHLGLSSDEYKALTSDDYSRSSSPVFFSSRSSEDSGRSSSRTTRRGYGGGQSPTGQTSDSQQISVVQTNARVVKWLCRLSQS